MSSLAMWKITFVSYLACTLYPTPEQLMCLTTALDKKQKEVNVACNGTDTSPLNPNVH